FQGPSPFRICVVLRWTVPLHAGVGEQRPPEHALLDPSFEFADLRFNAVLKHYAKFYVSRTRGLNQCVSSGYGNVDRFFRKDVKTSFCSRDPLRRMQARWAPDGDEIHGGVIEKVIELGIGLAPKLIGKPPHFFGIGAIDRRNAEARNRKRRTR